MDIGGFSVCTFDAFGGYTCAPSDNVAVIERFFEYTTPQVLVPADLAAASAAQEQTAGLIKTSVAVVQQSQAQSRSTQGAVDTQATKWTSLSTDQAKYIAANNAADTGSASASAAFGSTEATNNAAFFANLPTVH